MDISKIKRRERRFYRKEENGEIIYTDTPIAKTKKENKNITVKKETELKSTKSIPEKTLKSIKENNKLNFEEKQKVIDKILGDLRNTINPDIDEIADMIYAQLSVRDVNVTQESVKQVVQNNAHYRRSHRDDASNQNTSSSNKSGNYDFLNDRKELETVIDDIVEENKKEDIRGKAKKEKEIEDKLKLIKNKAKTQTQRESKTKTASKKEEPKEKSKQERKEFKLDFGDDETHETFSDSDDELGLKF